MPSTSRFLPNASATAVQMSRKGSTRREILQSAAVAGGGLAVGISIGGADRAAAQKSEPEVTAWVVIRPDEQIIIRVARSDLGQGTPTALAQLVAEELDCDWNRVSVEQVGPAQNLARDRVWRDFVTAGSRGLRGSQEYMRLAGASARYMLTEAAANLWTVPFTDLKISNGVISHAASGRTATFGRLAPLAAKLRVPDPRLVKFSEPDNWTIVGKPKPQLGLAEKLDGRAVYGIDVKLPGMLSAAIRDCPEFGGKVERFDDSVARLMPGVRRVLKVGESAVAVVADSWWQAHSALGKISIAWEKSTAGLLSSETIAEQLKDGLEATQAFIGTAHGDALKALRTSAKKIEAVYAMPFAHQATLEPMTAVARWTTDRVDVWAATQNAEAAQKAAADAAGVAIAKAEIHRVLAGGAFGRRGRTDYITQAVLIARAMPGIPVKLIWSREEDIQHGFYRPVSQAKLTGGLDEKGELSGLIMRISGQSIVSSGSGAAPRQQGRDVRAFQCLYPETGEAQIGYSVSNLYIDHAMRNSRVPVGSWRGVYSNQNTLYLECFIDELAHAAGRDALEFRRSLMRSHGKHLAVLTAAAIKAGWGQPLAGGRHLGMAQAMAFGSYAAAVAEVSVSGSGRLRVHRMVVALDCGRVVNPAQVEAQIEGSVAFGLGSLLHQEITIRDGRTVEGNFDSYGVLKLAEMPAVECVLLPSGDFWGGVGEATIGVVAPAVLNAVFAATGKRVRTLPLKNVKLV